MMPHWDEQSREHVKRLASEPGSTAERDQARSETIDQVREADAYIVVTLKDTRVHATASYFQGSESLADDAAGLCRGAADALIALWFSHAPTIEALVELCQSFEGSAAEGLARAIIEGGPGIYTD